MAFVRKRITSSGNLSATLVEPYRDSAGKPRQRVLANLYGCETVLEALAKLSAQRRRLRQERKEIKSVLAKTADWSALALRLAMDPAEAKRIGMTAEEYRDLNKVMTFRKKAQTRLPRIDVLLGRVQKDGAVIRKHVEATDQQVQQAIKDYQERLNKAEMMIQGVDMSVSMAKREFARLSLPGEAHKKIDKGFIRNTVLAAEKARSA